MECKRFNQWGSTIYYIGIFTSISGFILLLPLITIIFYIDELIYAPSFLIPAFISIVLGLILAKKFKGYKERTLSVGEDAVIVVSGWILATVFSAIPFIIGQNLNFTQAYFEAVSGWTTTGLSVIDVESAPHIFLIHRSIMQFFGGVGIVLVMLSALSSTQKDIQINFFQI